MNELLNLTLDFLSEFLWIYLPITVLVIGFFSFLASFLTSEETKKEKCKKLGLSLLWAAIAVFFAFPCVVFFWLLTMA